MSNIKKILSLLGAVLLIFATGSVHAVPFVFTTYGTISSGVDYAGIFGTAGNSLAGLKYTQSISFDPAQNSDNFDGYYYYTSQGPGATAVVKTEVNGYTFMAEVETSGSRSYASVANFLTELGDVYPDYAWSDSVYASTCSALTAPQFVCAFQGVRSYSTPFVSSATLEQSLSYAIQPGDEGEAYFSMSRTFDFTYFDATIDKLTWNAVPEPATLALMSIGILAGSAFSRRKQRKLS